MPKVRKIIDIPINTTLFDNFFWSVFVGSHFFYYLCALIDFLCPKGWVY